MLGKNECSDQELVHRTLEGDHDAYGTLLKRYLQVVHAVIFAHQENHADAEDLAQETFLKAHQSLDTLKNSARFGPWLITIARNRVDFRRRDRPGSVLRSVDR